MYCKKLDKSFYFQAADYAETLLWIQAIKTASTGGASTERAVPALTAKAPGEGGHSLLDNEDGIDSPTRMDSLTLTANFEADRSAPATLGSERSTLIRDTSDVDSDFF